MAVIAQGRRDPDLIRDRLAPWLTESWLDGARAEVTSVTAFGEGGVSNETVRVSFTVAGRPGESHVVLRFPPAGRGVFPAYDLGREQRVLSALHSRGIPVPAPAIHVVDTHWLGEPFLAMPFVPGRVPASQPRPYVIDGWLHDLPPTEQQAGLYAFTDLLADLHAIDPTTLGIEALGRQPGSTPLERTVRWWRDYLDWTREGNDAGQAAGVEAVYDWCLAHWPENEPPASFIWGDARLGNAIFDHDLAVAAAMDWECSTIGPAEIDLGWHFAHRLNMGALVGIDELPELSGFPGPDDQLARYGDRLGRPVADLTWYMLFGAAGLATCRLAVQRGLVTAGQPALAGAPLRPWVERVVHGATS